MENLRKYWPLILAFIIVIICMIACAVYITNQPASDEKAFREKAQKTIDSAYAEIDVLSSRIEELNRRALIWAIRKDSIQNELLIIKNRQHETRDHFKNLIDSVGRFNDDDIERYFSDRATGKTK